MKVLKNNYNDGKITAHVTEIRNQYPRKLTCDMCDSELEYEKSDIRFGEYGCAYIDCPLCGENNFLEDGENDITLTKYNVEFPTHFHHTSKETGAVDVCNNEMVKEYVCKAIDYFRKNKDEDNYGGHITGNFYISVDRYSEDEEYCVTVSNDFYETYIQFEKEDY